MHKHSKISSPQWSKAGQQYWVLSKSRMRVDFVDISLEVRSLVEQQTGSMRVVVVSAIATSQSVALQIGF